MAHTFSYSVLTAIPDPRRGERVNVGVAVFLPERVDIKLAEVAKVRALTGTDWDAYIGEATARITSLYRAGEPAPQFVERASMLEPVLKLSEAGWLSITRPEQYDERVGQILDSLVKRPRHEEKPKTTRINTEIAKEFRRAKVLAKPEEGIVDRKVIRDFVVHQEEALIADFAVKVNGKIEIATTLDLRKSSVSQGEAALKSIVLDKAEKLYNGSAHTIGIYAAHPGAIQFKSHIELLNDYAGVTYNWQDPEQRIAFTRRIYDATLSAGSFGLK